MSLEGFALSSQQRRLWRLGALDGASPYRVCAEYVCRGGAVEDWTAALRGVAEDYESLHTGFHGGKGKVAPLQIIAPAAQVEILGEDPDPWRRLSECPFGPEACAPLSAQLVQRPDGAIGLFVALPALCADMESLHILARALCRRRAGGGDAEFVQYADYAQWQSDMAATPEAAQASAAWRARFDPRQMATTLALTQRHGAEHYRPCVLPVPLTGALAERLATRCHASGPDQEALLAACWLITLARISGQPRQTIGYACSARHFPELAEAIGPMSQSVPVSGDIALEQRFTAFVETVAVELDTARSQADGFVWAFGGDEAPLFPAGFSYFTRAAATCGAASVELCRADGVLDRHALQLACEAGADGAMRVALRYDGNRFRACDAQAYATLFHQVLEDALADSDRPLAQLGALRASQWRSPEPASLQPAAADGPGIDALFQAVAAEAPQRVAVRCGGDTLRYDELDAQSNRWARYLQSLGVCRDCPVIVAAERSVLLPVLLLAVMKAGGAYVPLEAGMPAERLRKIVAATAAPLMLGSRRAPPLPAGTRYIDVAAQAERVRGLDAAPVAGAPAASDLAYVIFTSGSSGEPKGVAVEHRQLRHYIEAVRERLDLKGCESFAHVSSIAADLGNTTLFAALLGGGSLVLANEEEMLNGEALARRFAAAGGIDVLKIAPSHLRALRDSAADPAAVLPRRRLILGGERLDWVFADELAALAPDCRIANHYGPTEATIGALVYDLWRAQRSRSAELSPSASVPLGTQLGGVGAIVLDAAGMPVLPGSVGELHLTGAGLARGYFRDPIGSAEAFVDLLLFGGQAIRCYRTGDRVRLLPDGTHEFVGRTDRQIKLHGVRIELGEIEAAACADPVVRSAAALLRPVAGDREGVVLFVAASGLDEAALRATLEQRLPAQMVPVRIVILRTLPVTANGKCDYAALAATPLPERHKRAHMQPRTETERTLAAIWAEVLAVPEIGIEDDFFNLGGDSILGIQIVARAGEAGIAITPGQLFEHRCIAKLAAVARRRAATTAEQGRIAGQVPLTPIQHWFFAQDLPEPWHWNMSLLLAVDRATDAERLARAIDVAVQQHDALRMTFSRDDQGWQQANASEAAPVQVARVDLSAMAPADAEAAISATAAEVQTSLDLSRPPLVRAVLFELGEGRGCRILFVVHHLVMDAVSWHPFLDTVAQAYAALEEGRAIELPPKTSSFRQWAKMLCSPAASDWVAHQTASWCGCVQSVGSLPRDFEGGRNLVATAETVERVLDVETTQALLRHVPVAYQTQIDDALLTGLVRSFASWSGDTTLFVELEGHGRAAGFSDLDLSRTVGWFTTRWPQRLSVAGCADIGAALRSVKEQLRAVEDRGIGYGLLRYVREAPGLVGAAEPELSFNYLGQVDATLPLAGGWRFASEPVGPERSPAGRRAQLIAIDAMVLGGRLHLRWTYSREVHARRTIESLAESYCAELRAIVRHCTDEARARYTPSDFPYAGLDDDDLSALLDRYSREPDAAKSMLQQLMTLHLLWEGADDEQYQRSLRKLAVEDVFALSPMQQGLLFDILYADDASLYQVQKCITIEGPLEPTALRKAFDHVVARHTSLRTVYAWKGVKHPVQVVLAQLPVPWAERDLSALPPSTREVELEALAQRDWQAPLALDRGPVMRLTLVRLADDRHVLIWTHHHMLLDGWCNSLLLREVLDQIEAHGRGDVLLKMPPPSYRDYVAWLADRPVDGDEAWWRREMAGALLPTPIGFARPVALTSEGQERSVRLALRKQESEALQHAARRLGLTLSTIFNGAWGLLLARHGGRRDVVFAITTAVRPPELPGVERMVGLMINVLPLRLEVAPEQTLADWLAAVQAKQNGLLEHQTASLAQVRRWAGVRPGQALFDSHVSFENYPVDRELLATGARRRIAAIGASYRTRYPLSITVEPELDGPGLLIDAVYDPARFERPALERALDDWLSLLRAIPDSLDRPIGVLDAAPAVYASGD